MSQNYCLETPDLFLVPYEAGHVPKYHRWMETKELLKLTASDALTLEEVFLNQLALWAKVYFVFMYTGHSIAFILSFDIRS